MRPAFPGINAFVGLKAIYSLNLVASLIKRSSFAKKFPCILIIDKGSLISQTCVLLVALLITNSQILFPTLFQSRKDNWILLFKTRFLLACISKKYNQPCELKPQGK